MGWTKYYLPVAGLVIFSAEPSFSQSSNPPPVTLYRTHAECLRDHADRYLEFVDGPTLIFTGFCGSDRLNPTPAEVAAATSQNSFKQSSILSGRNSSGRDVELPGNEKAAAVVLTGQQIECLRTRFEDIVVPGKMNLEDGKAIQIADVFLGRC